MSPEPLRSTASPLHRGRDAPAPAVRQGTVLVDGVAVAWERWPHAGRPPVVLVHGTSAHSGWWHHTVPGLIGGYDVVAVDLSGHGDSGRRDRYSMSGWADEVLGVVAELHGSPVLLVGHNIGGLVAAEAAARGPDLVAGLVLVDCLVSEPDRPADVAVRPRGGSRVFPSVQAAVERFRLEPPQPVLDRTVLDYVAARSVRPAEGGWTWKVDSRIWDVVARPGPLTGALAGVRCPAAVVRGERSSLVGPDAGEVLARLLDRPVRQYDVAEAHHHVMVDQRDAFAGILRAALDDLVRGMPGFSRPVPGGPRKRPGAVSAKPGGPY